jgi:hypothetical protein
MKGSKMKDYLLSLRPSEPAGDVGEWQDDPRWSARKDTGPGDLILVYVAGVGIKYLWRALSTVSKAIRNSNGKPGWFAEMLPIAEFKHPLTCAEMKYRIPREDWTAPHANFQFKVPILLTEEIFNRLLLFLIAPAVSFYPQPGDVAEVNWLAPDGRVLLSVKGGKQ